MAASREPLGDLEREQRLAGAGRPRDRGALAVGHEGEHPRLVVGELDDLLVLLVEREPKRQADLDAVPEREPQGLHAL